MRVGIGYDVHKLVGDRDLIIGGVSIPYEKGLLGHSDADVLLHAIMDAILGAAGLGDIGRHFPDTEDEYKGASSMFLLAEVYDKISKAGYQIGNVDAVIICEKPKMKPYIEEMEQNIAKTLCTEIKNINIKATTTEKLGFAGRGEGIASEAIVLLV